MQAQTHLTKQAIKSIIEQFETVQDTSVILQVIDVKSFDDQKKNIAARVTLSDGVSKMLAFVTNKANEELVSKRLKDHMSR
jgi:hypothetical protein